MAEFQEVMRQLNRMCSHYPNCGDNDCPLFDKCGNVGSYSSNAKRAMWIEKIVMSWAAKHPEPVYPTWYAWLANMGVVPAELPPDQAVMVTDIGLLKKIPADIAQKLGIEPKEG